MTQGPIVLKPKRLFIVAGETSGDIHASNLIRKLRQAEPDLVIDGLGGPRMAEAGCNVLVNMLETMDIMWFKAVLANIKKITGIRDLALEHMRRNPPDAFVTVDYPGFNLYLARHVRKLPGHVPAVYYIAPQIWAWWVSRWKKIKARFDKVLCIFPFEQAFYRRFDVPVRYVGHPLFDHLEQIDMDASFRGSLQMSEGDRLVALLPGTRIQHIDSKLPVMLKAARMIHRHDPHVHFVIPCLDQSRKQHIKAMLARHHLAELPLQIVMNRTFELMKAADLAITASGSTTLELAHFGTPMVVVYRVSRFDKLMAWALKKTRYIAMVNILGGREVVPEFLCHTDTDEVGKAALEILENPERAHEVKRGIAEVMSIIDHPGASQRAAEEILAMMNR